jgi:hypothetical protein
MQNLVTMTSKISMNLWLFTYSKNHCFHLHPHGWAHVPSTLLSFKLLTSCPSPPLPSMWTQPPICRYIISRWGHEGVWKLGDGWDIGCPLKSSLIRIDTIGVDEDKKGCLHGWGDVVHSDGEGCLHGQGLCLHGRVVSVQMGCVRSDKWCPNGWVVSTQMEPCIYVDRMVYLFKKHIVRAIYWHGFLHSRYSRWNSQKILGLVSVSKFMSRLGRLSLNEW